MFKMSFNQEQLAVRKTIPPGIYKVRFVKFNPKMSKAGDSINLNAEVEVFDGEYAGTKIFAGLNSKIPSWLQDFVHSFGIPMENQNTDDASIPGTFDGDPEKFNAGDPSSWVYAGPLTDKIAEWEIAVDSYEGRERNSPRCFICAVSDCANLYPQVSHTKDMMRKSS